MAGFGVGAEEIFGRFQLVHAFPAATRVGLHVGRETDVLEGCLPIHHVQVTKAALTGIGGALLAGQQQGFGHGYAQAYGQGIIEEFLVGRPPEGIINYGRTHEGGVFEVGSVEGYILRNSVNDDGVVGGYVLLHLIDKHEFGSDIGRCYLVYAVDKSLGEGVFLSEKNADFFHKERV